MEGTNDFLKIQNGLKMMITVPVDEQDVEEKFRKFM